MSERLERWIDATRSCVRDALAAPADTERLLEAWCAVDALASIAPLLGEPPAPGVARSEARDEDPLALLRLSTGERRSLIARGKLAIGPASRTSAQSDGDERDESTLALRLARDAARRGLARVMDAASRPASDGALPPPIAGERVPERTLLRLVRGELDGFRAQEIARRIAASTEGRLELRLLLGLPAFMDATVDLPVLRLAADGPAEVRDPATGTPAGSLRATSSEGPLELEAVRFEDGVLGIYASRPIPLVLAGSSDGTVRGSAPGYLELDDTERTRGARGFITIALRFEDREAILKVRPRRK